MERKVLNGREVVAVGMEHVVVRPRCENPEVLKKSRLFNSFSFWPKDPREILRQELRDAQSLVSGTNLAIPRTQIYGVDRDFFGFKINGFVVRQDFIEEDGSVSDVQKYLADQNLDSLVEELRHEPRNFISRKGIVYWVDPTRGTIGRMLERLGVMKVERYRKIRRRMSKVIRFFGL